MDKYWYFLLMESWWCLADQPYFILFPQSHPPYSCQLYSTNQILILLTRQPAGLVHFFHLEPISSLNPYLFSRTNQLLLSLSHHWKPTVLILVYPLEPISSSYPCYPLEPTSCLNPCLSSGTHALLILAILWNQPAVLIFAIIWSQPAVLIFAIL